MTHAIFISLKPECYTQQLKFNGHLSHAVMSVYVCHLSGSLFEQQIVLSAMRHIINQRKAPAHPYMTEIAI